MKIFPLGLLGLAVSVLLQSTNARPAAPPGVDLRADFSSFSFFSVASDESTSPMVDAGFVSEQNGSALFSGPMFRDAPNGGFPYVQNEIERGFVVMHPQAGFGATLGAQIAYTVPVGGSYSLRVRFARANDFFLAGDGVTVKVFREDIELFSGDISSLHAVDADHPFDGDGVLNFSQVFTGAAALTPGEHLKFAVFPGDAGDGTFDATAIDVSLVPTPLAFGPELWVTSFNNNRLIRFDAETGSYLGDAVSGGNIQFPQQFDLDPQGNIYLASAFGNEVLKFDGLTGQFLESFVPSGSGGLNNAIGLTFGSDGRLYVGSWGTSEVLRFDGQTGEFLSVLTSVDNPSGFVGGNDVKTGPHGNLYLSSYGDQTVKVLNPVTGELIMSTQPGALLGIQNVTAFTIEANGDILVADGRSGGGIYRFDGVTGQFKTLFIPPGTGQMDFPIGIFVSGPFLYVCDPFRGLLRFDSTTGAFVDLFIPAGAGGLDGLGWVKLIDAPKTIADGLDNQSFSFSTEGTDQWRYDPDVSLDGVDSVTARVEPFGEATLKSSVTGPGYLSFFWKAKQSQGFGIGAYLGFSIDADQPSGTVIEEHYPNGEWHSLTFHLSPGNHELKWEFLDPSGSSVGDDVVWLDELTFEPLGDPLASIDQAVDYPGSSWYGPGPTDWQVVTDESHLNGSAIRSGPVYDNGSSWIETPVTGPGMIGFWWKTSSQKRQQGLKPGEDIYEDYLAVLLDGVELDRISGKLDWSQRGFYVPPGEHKIGWVYQRQGNLLSGLDAGWLDEFSFTAGDQKAVPFINGQPESLFLLSGRSATLTVNASGVPPLSYQWFKGNSAIPGATESELHLNPAGLDHTGKYKVRVQNTSGATFSQEAILNVTSDSSPFELAWYTFDGHVQDVLGKNEPGDVDGAPFVENTLRLSGKYEFYDGGFRAIFRVPNLRYDSFAAAFDFKPDFANGVVLMGGDSYRWFGIRVVEGQLAVGFNQFDFMRVFDGSAVNVGEWNSVAVSIDLSARRVITFLNGTRLPDITLDPDFKLEVIEQNADYDKEFTFTNYSDGEAYSGLADNLRIFARALGVEEMASLFTPDLVVNNVTVPETVIAGRPFTVSWNVANIGNAAAHGPWMETVYLTETDNPNAQPLSLGSIEFSGDVPIRDSVSRTLDITIPPGVSGFRKSIIITADSGNAISERDESNNDGLANAPIVTGVSVIPLSQSTSLPPPSPGAGLRGAFYAHPDGSLLRFQSDADTWISSHDPTATFRATSIDYPKPGNSDNTITELLGDDASTLQPPQNDPGRPASVWHFTGFIAIRPEMDTDPSTPEIDVQFAMGSDDGSQLRIGNVEVLNVASLNLDDGTERGAYNANDFRAIVTFQGPGLYPIEITWWDWFGGISLRLFSSIPGNSSPDTPAGFAGIVPTTALYHSFPDLIVQKVIVPSTVTPGSSFTAQWDLVNQGSAAISAAWKEAIYLSSDDQIGGDTLLQVVDFNGDLSPGQNVTRTATVPLPFNVPSGAYHLVVQTDSESFVTEQDEANNASVSSQTFDVPSILTLTLPISEISEGAANPIVQAIATRSGPTTTALAISAESSDATEATVPAVITIPVGQASTVIPITVQKDGIVDGPQPVSITISAPGFEFSSAGFTVLDIDVPKLAISVTPSFVTEGQTASGVVTRDTITAQPLAVLLQASSPSDLQVPSSVIIPANQPSVSFPVIVVDDDVTELAETHTIAASASGFVGAAVQVSIDANDFPEIQIYLDRQIVSEGAGSQAAHLTVIRKTVTSQPLTVQFESSDPTAAIVSASATIPAFKASVSVPVKAVDDDLVDGAQLTQISAFALSPSGQRIATADPLTLQVDDDDGPTLKLSISPKVLPEGKPAAAKARLSRNTDTTAPLSVIVASDIIGEVSVPSTVVIPGGAAFVDFSIDTLADGVNDGDKNVTITAAAQGFTSGLDTVIVTDENRPDLVISQIDTPTTALTESAISVTYRVANEGLLSANGPFTQRVFLSSDALVGNDILVGQFTFNGEMPPGAYVEQTVPVTLPLDTGDYWIVVTADVDDAVDETIEDNNSSISSAQIHVNPAYTAEVRAGIHSALAGTPIPLTGQAIKSGTADPAPHVPVNIHVFVRGTERVLGALTDENGNFATLFTPLPGEAGNYQIGATHPGVSAAQTQDQFTLLGMQFQPASVALTITEQASQSTLVALQNLSDVPLTGLSANIVQNTGSLPASALLDTATLPGNGQATLSLNIGPVTTAVLDSDLVVRVQSAEGAQLDFHVAVTVDPLKPRLVSDPPQLVRGMVHGTQTTVEFDVTNRGGAPTGPISVLLPNFPWLSTASQNPMPSLAPGERGHVVLLLTPALDLPLIQYGGSLVLRASGNSLSIPFQFRSISEAKGNLQVTAEDEFTYFADGAPYVAGAAVNVFDAVSGETATAGTTDANGQFDASDLMEGYYRLEVSADRHSTYQATIFIAAGETKVVSAFMPRQSVRYIWTVEEIQIEDRTEIHVETTFETFVPTPVITVDPIYVDLSSLTIPGQKLQINYKIANHGLIAAQNGRFRFGQHPQYRITPLIENVGTIPANSQLTVPVTIERVAEAPVKSMSIRSLSLSCDLPSDFLSSYRCGGNDVDCSTPLAYRLPGCQQPPPPSSPRQPDNQNEPNPAAYSVPVATSSPTPCEECKDDISVHITRPKKKYVCAGEETTFTASCSSGTIKWRVGDQEDCVGDTCKHTFDQPGTYSVKATCACGKKGADDSIEVIVVKVSILQDGDDITDKPKHPEVVGKAINLSVRIDGPASFADVKSLQWEVPGTRINAYIIDQNSATKTPLTDQHLASRSLKFYWLDGSPERNVQVVVRFVDDFTCTAKASFEVRTPTVDTFTAQTTSVNVFFVTGFHGYTGFLLAFQTPSGIPGIAFDYKVSSPLGFAGLSPALCQVAESRTERGHQANTPCFYSGSNGQGLDVGFPLPRNDDSPSAPLDLEVGFFDDYAVVGAFSTWLMWRPSTADSIYVPMAVARWSFSGEASRIGNVWNLVPGLGNVPPVQIDTTPNDLPTWTKVYPLGAPIRLLKEDPNCTQ